jgi:CDP-diacylglycerol--glycerol-3-phosphate 3-phosphatidyltransferase
MKVSDEWDIDNLPNRLTVFRIALVPVIIISLYLQSTPWFAQNQLLLGHIAAWTFVLASITDFLDGHIARKRKIVTVFGSFLDPIADKCLVVSSLIILLALDRIPVLIVICLVLREIYIMALRLLSLERGLNLKVGKLGKWKTALQMTGIPMLMVYYPLLGIPFPTIGITMIYITTLLSIYSAIQYSLETRKKIKAVRKNKKELS